MKIKSYVSLTKPKIALLNLMTALISYFIGGGGLWGGLQLAFAGYLSVGGASAINHYLDMDIDSKMARTARRPIPSGIIEPRKALYFGVALVAVSVIHSALSLNLLTSLFILLGVVIYIFVYTLWLKRRSVWNIVIGGAAGSCSPLAGWAASGSEFTALPIILAALVFLWTPGHFWALAIRASEDYRSVGLPMLPVRYGFHETAVAALASNILSVCTALTLAPFVANHVVYLMLVASLSGWLIFENVRTIISKSMDSAWRAFKVSSPWLAVVYAALLLTWG
ncbi:MAG: heme o synthase [Candidatus Caldarchaeum sp.]|nr:heme o synthase [Candidatus Caldarchaeum sp.]